MNLQYAAGHNGDFRMAFACGGTTQNDLSAVRCSPGRARPGNPQRRGRGVGRVEG